MLSKECFTLKWIEKIKNDNAPADPTIIEKTIYAFELLSTLSELELDFIFKGGTSLLLLVNTPKRLSIDVDISTTESKEQVEKKLNEIIRSRILLLGKKIQDSTQIFLRFIINYFTIRLLIQTIIHTFCLMYYSKKILIPKQ